MNFSKVKTIFIALFLVVDLVLFGNFFITKNKEAKRIDENFESTIEYLTAQGISFSENAYIPRDTQKLPMLSVILVDPNDSSQEGLKSLELDMSYLDYKIVVSGKATLCVSIESVSETSKEVDSVTKALVKFYQDLKKQGITSGTVVQRAEIVYLVEAGGDAQSGQKDTATPAWRIQSSRGYYYYPAINE